jgi:hypothetical protein
LRATEAAEEAARAEGMSGAAPRTGSITLPPRVIFDAAAIDLDAALAKRRRAAGN